MVRAVDAQNEKIAQYMFSDDTVHHLGEQCPKSLGLSCKEINGQNKIIDLETTMLKGEVSQPVTVKSITPTPSVPITPHTDVLPFSVANWDLRSSKSVNTISLQTNTRMIEPIPHRSIYSHVGSAKDLFGVDSRQLNKYN